MITILGSANPCRPRIDRRVAMQIGGLGALSLSLGDLFRHQAQAAGARQNSTFGRAKRILLLYLQGAASQFETWDPKPDAPEEIRGKLGAISTSVAGVGICEKLPKLARLTDRLAIVRSMSHKHNNHSNLYTLTGHPAIDFTSETNPFDARHHPFFGSVLDYLEASGVPDARRPDGSTLANGSTVADGRRATDLPRNLGLPFQFSTHSPVFRRAGPYGAFLGSGYNPVWTEFDGKATKTVPRVSFFDKLADVEVPDPFLGITPESRLRLSQAARILPAITLDRLNTRRTLVQQLEEARGQVDRSNSAKSLDRYNAMAYSLLTSETMVKALDIGQEPINLRERYGMTLFGQSALTARRLLEAGCPLVSVFWDEYKVVNTAWDTHFDHFPRLEDELLPGFDSAVSSLLTDLAERGLLQETLVLCLTEHGRTPKIDNKPRGGGRDHWSEAYSVMLAGAGIRPGTVVGASDANGGFVKQRPVSPEDILATMYHLKGIDPDATTIPDRLNRPVRLTEHGRIVPELLG